MGELSELTEGEKRHDSRTSKFSGSLGVLDNVFSFFKVSGNAELGENRGSEKSSTKRQQAQIQYNYSALRRLIEITVHYMLNQEDRLMLVDHVLERNWRDPSFIEGLPRGLVFLDLPEGSMLVPTAMEINSGEIKLVYEELISKDGRELPPKYPEPEDGVSETCLLEQRKAYWSWYRENFSATKAMLKVEELSKNSRIRWIDYRLPIGTDGDTLHLRAWARGEYDNGVFAYNLIKRGFKHGLRLVGTIKQEPDLNLLAVFEK